MIEAEESTRPLIVGERTNVIGSRLFKQMISEDKWEEASEIARRQVRNGAHIVDVCLQSSEREEIKDVPPFYDRLIRKIKVSRPVCLRPAGQHSARRYAMLA